MTENIFKNWTDEISEKKNRKIYLICMKLTSERKRDVQLVLIETMPADHMPKDTVFIYLVFCLFLQIFVFENDVSQFASIPIGYYQIWEQFKRTCSRSLFGIITGLKLISLQLVLIQKQFLFSHTHTKSIIVCVSWK